MADSWSHAENEAIVADYFAMLAAELRGERINKSAHRRALGPMVKGRSDRSIEDKHMNISAVLRDLLHPSIDGYKPLGNYQQLLAEAVVDRLAADLTVRELVERDVSAPAEPPAIGDVLGIWESPPQPGAREPRVYEPMSTRADSSRPAVVDYAAQDARNRSLGRAGEELIMRFEARRLHHAGQPGLADRVEHVAETRGDGLGFDILSFEESGRERLIEVKTTAFGKWMPFYVSRNEVACSIDRPTEFHLYRLFEFRRSPRLFGVPGQLDRTCRLDPVQFVARVA